MKGARAATKYRPVRVLAKYDRTKAGQLYTQKQETLPVGGEEERLIVCDLHAWIEKNVPKKVRERLAEMSKITDRTVRKNKFGELTKEEMREYRLLSALSELDEPGREQTTPKKNGSDAKPIDGAATRMEK